MHDDEDVTVDSELASRRQILIAAGLFLEDPDSTPGLTFPVPEGVKIAELLTNYDTKATTGRKVRCAGCKTKTPHYRGFRVALDNGGLANIGIDCGESISHPGAWAELSSGLRRRQDKVFYDARVGPAVQRLDTMQDLLAAWIGRILQLDQFLGSIPTELQVEIAGTADTEGFMQLEKTRKLSKAETRARSGLRSEVYTKTYGRVPNPDYFRRFHPWASKALRIMKSAPEVRQKIAFANDLPDLVKAFSELRDLRKRMEEIHDDHGAALSNLAIDWWGHACSWANSNSGLALTWTVSGRQLTFERDYRDDLVITIPTRSEIGESLWPEIKALWPE